MRRNLWWVLTVAALAIVATCSLAITTALRGPLVGGWRLTSPEGYVMQVPASWQQTAGAPVETVLVTPGAQLNVWAQDLAGVSDAATYTGYSNRSVLQGWSGIKLQEDREVRRGDKRLRVLRWSRPPLRHVSPDLTEYREVNVIRDEHFVITLELKATPAALAQAAADQDALVDRLTFTKPTPVAGGSPWQAWQPFPAGGREWQSWQTKTDLRWQVPERGVVWGVYDWNVHPNGIKWAQVAKLEAETERPFEFLMTYTQVMKEFPTAMLQDAANHGRLVMLTLQSWVPVEQQRVFGSDLSLTSAILRGDHDAYFQRYARAAAGWGKPFFFRLDNEMNADWCPWGAFHNAKDADLYVAAWRHVWQIFQDEGAQNALWVWNPNDTSFPNYRWNHSSRYWPGAAYVDWVGLTGYNVGNAYPDSKWRNFREIYAPVYQEYQHLYPGKPLMITEFASHDGGGDKAAWMREMFAALPEFPGIKFAVWWNGTDGARRYRFDSTPSALQAMREGVALPYSQRLRP